MKKGISLVALVVIIIVLIILSGTILLNFKENNVVGLAEYAVERQRVAFLQEKITMEKQNEMLSRFGTTNSNATQNRTVTVQEILNVTDEDALNIVEANSIPENMPAGTYYEIDANRYSSRLRNERTDLALMSRGVDRENDLLNDTYVVSENFTVYYIIDGKIGEINNIEEERAMLQKIMKDNFLVDGEIEIEYEQLIKLLPEGWSLTQEDVLMGLRAVYTQNNTFYIDEWGTLVEQKGKDVPLWLIDEVYITYLGLGTVLNLDDNTILNNAYQFGYPENDNEVLKFIAIDNVHLSDVVEEECEIQIEGKHMLVEFSFNVSDAKISLEFANNLETLILGKNVKHIESNAFRFCTKLKNLTLSNGLISIGSFAFVGCSSITTVAIPSSVTSIGDGAFLNCNSLTNVKVGSQAVYDLLVNSNSGISADIITIDPSVG